MNRYQVGQELTPFTASALPIFRRRGAIYDLFYAPGYLAVVPLKSARSFIRELIGEESPSPVVTQLTRHARQAVEKRAETIYGDFRPVCLTLYLHNECNLGCTYCFVDPSPKPTKRLELPPIRAAARLVMDNCRDIGKLFTAVFHGGGEPALHHQDLRESLELLETMAHDRRLPIFRYIATNGVIPAEQAAWIARRFDLVGLSCDGPPEIQNRQRPTWGGADTFSHVERTARIIYESGTPLHVRVTITPQTIKRQKEIAAYICQTLKPQEIHVEPVYDGGRAAEDDAFSAEEAEVFIAEFFRAREVALGYGTPWSTSCSRPDDVHGPYCHIFRDVLNLVPGKTATACFKVTDEESSVKLNLDIGHGNGREFTLDLDRIQNLRRQLRVLPASCRSCFNQFHCTCGCPTACPIQENGQNRDFYCHIASRLTQTRLNKRANALWASRKDNTHALGQSIDKE